jgi:succinyl-diaminopimelate desuccinylase
MGAGRETDAARNGDRAVLADAIVKWARAHEEEMARLLAELVRVPTENPPGRNYSALTGVLARRLRGFGLRVERLRAAKPARARGMQENPACLLAGYGHGERALYFHGHYDVVPAQTREQFEPLRRKHFLFGRGACDMKGGIVAMLYAMRALRECGAELDGEIGLLLVPDEETGGARGSAWLEKEGMLGRRAIGMLTAEPTSGLVWNANRGAITLRVRVLGKSAHVGLQHWGENAFERMCRVVQRLQGLKREVERRTTAHSIGGGRELKRGNGRGAGLATEPRASAARNSILLLGGESGGGTNFNVVPEQCWFTVDRRINPEEDFEAEKARLLGVLEDCKRQGIPLECEILQEGRSAACGEDEKLGRALAGSVKTVTGKAPQFEMCPGLLETRFYAAKRIAAYAYGPGQLAVAHGPKEYVDMRRVAACAAIYALTAREMLTAS